MATNPVTYRVSPEVDAELKRLAKIHGGTDKALRAMLFEQSGVKAHRDQVEGAAKRLREVQARQRGPRPKGDKIR